MLFELSPAEFGCLLGSGDRSIFVRRLYLSLNNLVNVANFIAETLCDRHVEAFSFSLTTLR